MIVVAGLAMVFGGITWGLRKAENQLVVENRSGQPIAWLHITMMNSGQVITFKSIPDGGVETAAFQIVGDDSFSLNGRLADGGRVIGGFGYVTNGQYGVRPHFIVRQSGSVDYTD